MVRVYTSSILANAAAAYLRESGVPAHVFSSYDPWKGVLMRVEVDDVFMPQAAALLDEFDLAPGGAEPGWEANITPDLSGLDARYTAECTHCGAVLGRGDRKCGKCGRLVDVAEVLAKKYGPEILLDCYGPMSENDETVEDAGEDAIARALEIAKLNCPNCNYNLDDLGNIGICPECGQGYSKRSILFGT